MKIYVHHKYDSEIFWYFFHGVKIEPKDIPAPVLDIGDENIEVKFNYKGIEFTTIFCDDRLWNKKDGNHVIDSHIFQFQKKLINNRGWNDYFIENHNKYFIPYIEEYSVRLNKKLDIFLIDWEGLHFLKKCKLLQFQNNNIFLDEANLNNNYTFYPITHILGSFIYKSGLPIKDFYYFSDFLKLKKEFEYKLHYGVRRPTEEKVKNIENLLKINSDDFLITHSSYIHRNENFEKNYLKILTYFQEKVVPAFKKSSLINKRKYGIEDFGEELNYNNIREMMWKVIPLSEVEIIDEYIKDGYVSEKSIIRILAEKPFIPTNTSVIDFYKNICDIFEENSPEYPLKYKNIEDIVDLLNLKLKDDTEWSNLVLILKEYVSSLKLSLFNIINNNNSYLDILIKNTNQKLNII